MSDEDSGWIDAGDDGSSAGGSGCWLYVAFIVIIIVDVVLYWILGLFGIDFSLISWFWDSVGL